MLVPQRHPSPTLFPYTTLFRSPVEPLIAGSVYRASATVAGAGGVRLRRTWSFRTAGSAPWVTEPPPPPAAALTGRDRKSTRLNSSHLVISYAVFCLKKKKKHTE